MPDLSSVGFMITSVLVASISQILLKKSANKTYDTFLRQYLNPWVISGYALMVVSTLLVILAYHYGLEYKNEPIFESLGYPVILVLGFTLLGEKVTSRKIVGNLIIVIGILIFYL